MKVGDAPVVVVGALAAVDAAAADTGVDDTET